MFLTEEELFQLTGFKQKSRQAARLRELGVAFYLSAHGHPAVIRSAVEGGKKAVVESKEGWKPAWAKN